jgi:hypothetical protein
MDSIEKVLALFNSYMTNRTQQVQIGNALSNKSPLKYGVHEGSILGPLLFYYYPCTIIQFYSSLLGL